MVQHQTEVVATGRSIVGLFLSALAVLGLSYVVITGGSSDSGDASPTAESTPPMQTPTEPLGEPRIEGTLRSGAPFEVFEPSPGVLCVVFPDDAVVPIHAVPMADAAGVEASVFCHLELVTASGAAVIDDRLVVGYLAPDAASTTLRYRAGAIDNDGIYVEQIARFFAIPLRSDDPYRLQFRSADFDIIDEVPLVALAEGPSQSSSDAERDGVPLDIAALPFDRRVQIVADWTDLPEGPYAWSRTIELNNIAGWAEVLLLDETGTAIVRSTPLPTVRLNGRLVSGDSIYLIGQQVATLDEIAVDLGELQFPIVVAVIDRVTGAATVRLFEQESTSEEAVIAPALVVPGWLLGPPLPLLQPDSFGIEGETVELFPVEAGPTIVLDRVTLLPVTPIEP